MNKWYDGFISGYPVDIFVSDTWALDYFVGDDCPPEVIDACERIRKAHARSLNGVQLILQENGWYNE